MEDLKQFEQLSAEWLSAQAAALQAQKHIDDAMFAYLRDQGKAPTLREQEALDDLWYIEAEKRGNMDEFISERFG